MRRNKSRSNRSQRNRNRSHRKQRRQGGNHLIGAPVSASLAGSWSSKMSAGQGGDFMKYHAGQHGGSHLSGTPVGSAYDVLPAALRGPAHIGGLDKAMVDIAGMKDQSGGRRKKSKKSRKHCHRQRSHRQRSHRQRSHRHRQRRNRGGALGYAPFPSDGMLLKSQTQYAQAGLHPEWRTAVEYDLADKRASQ